MMVAGTSRLEQTDLSEKSQPMKSVFLVWHTHGTKAAVDEKFIGVYESCVEADAAVHRLRTKSGFRDSQGGFEVCEYVLGKDHWTEGFISESEAFDSNEE